MEEFVYEKEVIHQLHMTYLVVLGLLEDFTTALLVPA
jgi:hypothetical protein